MFPWASAILGHIRPECEGSGNGEGEGTSPDAEKKNSTLGRELPEYIGSLEQRKEYMIKLFDACGGQNQVYKINEKQISFHNCTYFCVKRNRDSTAEVHRIPVGMICNRDKGTCPKEGDCPLPMC
uniref:Uncharacterized protein n=1 Tax=Ixodes ricinus TaxID=34613 RepID=A0A6B0UQL8_IXORI